MAAAARAAAARAALRRLLRAQRESFRGDLEMQRAAKATIRERFRQHAGERDPATIERLLVAADEAVQFLRQNVVQAPLNERGNYEVDVRNIDETRR